MRLYDFAVTLGEEDANPAAVGKAKEAAKEAAKDLLGGSLSALRAIGILASEPGACQITRIQVGIPRQKPIIAPSK